MKKPTTKKAKQTKAQKLRLVHQRLGLLQKDFNAAANELRQEIETLLPPCRRRNLTVKEMRDRIEAC